MSTLQNKIDFTMIITATNANPNGDPLEGNRPRTTFEGNGEISDVCIKRKIRNRLQDMGYKIFVQSDDRCDDGCDSLKARAESVSAIKAISRKGKMQIQKNTQESPVRSGSMYVVLDKFLHLRKILFRILFRLV